MPARGRRHRRAAPTPRAAGRPVVLDWRGPEHWSWTDMPCRYCGFDTPLRDSKGKPAHKTCAEDALVIQAAEAADAYEKERLH